MASVLKYKKINADGSVSWKKITGGEGGGGEAEIKYEKVAALPTEDIDPTTIYLVKAKTSGDDDHYDEFIFIDGKWERFGSMTAASESISGDSADIADIGDIFV